MIARENRLIPESLALLLTKEIEVARLLKFADLFTEYTAQNQEITVDDWLDVLDRLVIPLAELKRSRMTGDKAQQKIDESLHDLKRQAEHTFKDYNIKLKQDGTRDYNFHSKLRKMGEKMRKAWKPQPNVEQVGK